MEKRFYFPAEFEIRCAKILFKCSSRVWCKRFRGMFLINFLRTKKFNSFLSDLSLCTTVESASKHKKITIPSSTHSVAVCLRFYWICYSESHSVYQLKQSMWWGVIESRVNQLFLEAFCRCFQCRQWPMLSSCVWRQKCLDVKKVKFLFAPKNLCWLKVSKIAAPLDLCCSRIMIWLQQCALLLALLCLPFLVLTKQIFSKLRLISLHKTPNRTRKNFLKSSSCPSVTSDFLSTKIE